MTLNVRELNREAWDALVERGNRWTVPVSSAETAAARRGEWQIVLTPTRAVPRSWFPPLAGAEVLCLGSGGGQQGPVLAAAGATVTVFDNSPRQLDQDRMVAERDGLEIATVEGDMADLGDFPDAAFDLIVHPVSNAFVADVHPVWRECARVLRARGTLLAGFTNPVRYLFAEDLEHSSDVLHVVHEIPYSDVEQLSAEERERFIADGEPFEFSHTLSDQIAGQLQAGFVITGFYEDAFPPNEDLLSRYLPTFIATRSVRS